ncbi:uncharacterized protein TRIVIDRAFT_67712 [Trichoderma virens Gv29-8]|uniref:DUF7779 domain-containing protein n=1 Tax=Hypocrea virens (strain Gv29-8 / FGSC 10586) TaxID=413071 RepID=G9MQG1_HYPVG|nr:uncharacterized protein TRIVIDRAFT_67712 [Trichoderma virens Gv29-8]EHK24082.1 hypothetical protein TRIVIDRAFT_67712 [Trichoderma virens Gv29-8]
MYFRQNFTSLTQGILGGLTWKQVIPSSLKAYANMAEKRHENNNVLDRVFGIVFLGTPHIEDASQLDINIVEAIVVTEEQASLPSNPRAITYGIPSNHENLCKIEIGGKLYEAIAQMIDAAVLKHKSFSITRVVTGALSSSGIESHQDTSQNCDSALLSIEPKQDCKTPSASAGHSSNFAYEVVPSTNQFETVQPKLRIPCFSVGSQTRKSPFFGRDDIFRSIDKSLLPESIPSPIDEELSRKSGNLKTFALCGAGGIGKTELASEYIFTRKDKYLAIFWVTAESRNVLLEDFARIAVELGLQEKSEARDLAEACELVKGWLCNPVKNAESPLSSPGNEISWLLVLDNVNDWGIVEDFWPTTGIGSILITSRDPLSRSHVFTAQNGLDLDPLSSSDSLKFLCAVSRTHFKGSSESAEAIAEWAGGLPLVISAIASTMSARNLTYDSMLALLEKNGFEAVSVDNKPQMRSVQDASVSIASMIGLAHLDECTQSLIYAISFMNPEGIHQKFLIDSSDRAQLPAFPKNHGELSHAQNKLQKASLIIFNELTHTIRMHRIYQDIVRESLSPEVRVKALLTALEIISEAWVYQPLEHRFNTARYEVCSAIFPHVDRIYHYYEEMFRSKKIKASEQAASLFNDAGWYCFERGVPHESKPFYRLAEGICRSLQQTSPTQKVAELLRECHNNQGSAANETNSPQESLRHNLIWLSLMRERKSSDGKQIIDYELGCAYNEVGVAYAMNNMYPLAIDSFKESISTYMSIPDYDEKWLGWPLPNIGMMYWIQGNHKLALKALHRMRNIYEAAYGRDDRQSFKTGKVLYGIGNVYLSLGDLEYALGYHFRALSQWSETLGRGHHRIGDVSHKIAQDLMGLGQFERAQEYLTQALRIFARRPHHRHEHARTTFKQGQLYLASGNVDKADQSFKAAHKQRQSLIPQDIRSWDELIEKDYDELVIFMSR